MVGCASFGALIFSLLAAATPEIDFPPQDREVMIGAPANFGVIPRATSGATFQWYKDNLPIPGATNDQIVLNPTRFRDGGIYSVSVSVGGDSTTNSARLTIRPVGPGDLDLSFRPDVGITEHWDHQIVLRQPDGKFVVVGSFGWINGNARGCIARLNPDGSTDTTFSDGLPGCNSTVHGAGLQNDGKLVIYGYFSKVNGQLRASIARLNRDGSLDSTFTDAGAPFPAAGWAQSLAIQRDGKILLGTIRPPNGTGPVVYRLKTDGSLDQDFQSPWGSIVNGPVINVVAEDTVGRIVVGLSSQRTPSSYFTNVVRLKSNGELDRLFSPPTDFVTSIDFQSSGDLIIGGQPTVGRWHDDGTRDSSFVAPFQLRYPFSVTKTLSNGKIAVSGVPTNSTATTTTMALLGPDGALDPDFHISEMESPQIVLTDAQDNILVSYGSTTRSFAWIDTAGNLQKPVPFEASVGGPSPKPIALQGDSKLLVSTGIGSFLRRLNVDGSMDSTFQPEVPNLSSVCVERDDKIVVGGAVYLATTPAANPSILRLTQNGDVDPSFSAVIVRINDWRPGYIGSIRQQRDNKILVGGLFSSVNGFARINIARLNGDGTFDASFAPILSGHSVGDPEYPTRPYVSRIQVQDNGKILVAGLFDLVNGVPRTNFVRLNSDGSLDTSFNPPGDVTSIAAIATQADGKVLVASRTLDRLNEDGTRDTTFQNGVVQNVFGIVVTPKQDIFVSGGFTSIGGVNRPFLAKLDSTGAVDQRFLIGLSGPDAPVSILPTPDGELIVSGGFTKFNDADKPALVRIFQDTPLPRITSVRLFGSELSVEWTAVPNVEYRIEQKLSIGQSTWSEIPGSILAANETAMWTIDLQKGGTQFFRVKRQP